MNQECISNNYEQMIDLVEPIIYPHNQIDSFKEQALMFQKLMNKLNLDKLDSVYIISSRWLQRWKIYISYEEFINGLQPSKYLGGPDLWKINDDLVYDQKPLFHYYPKNSHKWNIWLKPGQIDNKDLIFINEEIWNLLRQQSPQCIPIIRSYGGNSISKHVEIYLKKVNVVMMNQTIIGNIKNDKITRLFNGFIQTSNFAPLQEWIQNLERVVKEFKQYDHEINCIQLWKIKFSQKSSVEEIYAEFKKQLQIQNNVRDYQILCLDSVYLCPKKYSSVQDCEISEDDLIIIDAREKGRKQVITNSSTNSSGLGRCSWCRLQIETKIQCECGESSYCKEECQNSDLKFHVKNCSFSQMKYELSLKEKTQVSVNGICGLYNLGNTCFMNSGLQCLSNSIVLANYFLNDIYKEDINLSNVLGTHGELASSFAMLMKHLWYGKEKQYAPIQFKKQLAKYYTMFSGFQQHDSQEFLMYILDGLHEDLNQVKKKPYVDWTESNGRDELAVAIEHWDCHQLRNKSIIVDYFFAQFKSEVQCQQCKYITTKYEPYLTVQLPLISQPTKDQEINDFVSDSNSNNFTKKQIQEITLQDCFEFYQQCVHLDVENLWYCPKCKDHVASTQTLKLYSAPQFLIISLKRFGDSKHSVKTKINTFVKYPLDFNLSDYVITHQIPREYGIKVSKETNILMYELYAVINHYGGMDGGHYTSFAKNHLDGNFYEYNDQQVKIINNVVTENAYVLFYQRKEL